MISCSDVVGNHFGGSYCPHSQGEVNGTEQGGTDIGRGWSSCRPTKYGEG